MISISHNAAKGSVRSVYCLVVDNNAGVKSMCHRIIYAFLIQLWIPASLGHLRDQSSSALSMIFHWDFPISPKLIIQSAKKELKSLYGL